MSATVRQDIRLNGPWPALVSVAMFCPCKAKQVSRTFPLSKPCWVGFQVGPLVGNLFCFFSQPSSAGHVKLWFQARILILSQHSPHLLKPLIALSKQPSLLSNSAEDAGESSDLGKEKQGPHTRIAASQQREHPPGKSCAWGCVAAWRGGGMCEYGNGKPLFFNVLCWSLGLWMICP